MERLYKTFCGYVHANFSHTMEVYNGQTRDFNLRGVPSDTEREKRQPYLDLMANNVLLAAAYAAQKLELEDHYSALMKTLVDV